MDEFKGFAPIVDAIKKASERMGPGIQQLAGVTVAQTAAELHLDHNILRHVNVDHARSIKDLEFPIPSPTAVTKFPDATDITKIVQSTKFGVLGGEFKILPQTLDQKLATVRNSIKPRKKNKRKKGKR